MPAATTVDDSAAAAADTMDVDSSASATKPQIKKREWVLISEKFFEGGDDLNNKVIEPTGSKFTAKTAYSAALKAATRGTVNILLQEKIKKCDMNAKNFKNPYTIHYFQGSRRELQGNEITEHSKRIGAKFKPNAEKKGTFKIPITEADYNKYIQLISKNTGTPVESLKLSSGPAKKKQSAAVAAVAAAASASAADDASASKVATKKVATKRSNKKAAAAVADKVINDDEHLEEKSEDTTASSAVAATKKPAAAAKRKAAEKAVADSKVVEAVKAVVEEGKTNTKARESAAAKRNKKNESDAAVVAVSVPTASKASESESAESASAAAVAPKTKRAAVTKKAKAAAAAVAAE